MKQITIKITQEDIDRNDRRADIIVHAIRREIPSARRISADLLRISWRDKQTGLRHCYFTPRKIQEMMTLGTLDFEKPQPCSIRLKAGEIIA
jgi:hypothetical protein